MDLIQLVSYFLTLIFMDIVVIKNYQEMSSKKISFTKKVIFVILISSLFSYINNIYNLLSLRFFTGIIITIILTKIVFKDTLKDAIFYSIIHGIVFVILELLFSPLLYGINSLTMLNNTIYLKVLFSIIVSFISLIVFKNDTIISLIKKAKCICFEKINNNVITIIILLIINFLIVYRAIISNDITLIIISIITSLFMIIVLKIIINDKYNIKLVNEQNKNIKDSYTAYSETIDECKEMKHNLKNDLLSIKISLPKKEQENFNKLITKYNTDYEWINKIGDIPEGLQGLFYLKQKEAKTKKVNLFINVKKNISINNKDYMNMCSIIGILLDNAIEAALKSNKKIVYVNFEEYKNLLKINIINTFTNNVDINKIGKKNYSTKEYKSGIGLDYIKKLKSDKIKVTFKIVNDIFITNIFYENKKPLR